MTVHSKEMRKLAGRALRCVLLGLLGLGWMAGVPLSGRASDVGELGDWPQWHGPARDNISRETELNMDWRINPPKKLWEVPGMGSGYASVSVLGNRLYTTGNDETAQNLVCVDLDQQQVLWKTPLTKGPPGHGYDGSRCSPAISDGLAYVVTSNGAISCVDATSGKLVWAREFSEWKGQLVNDWGFSESPLVDGDAVLCSPGGPDAAIVKLNKKTGKEIWRCAIPELGDKGKDGAGYSSMVISNAANTKQYVQLAGRGTVGVDAKTGKFLWGYNRVANGVANIPTPVVDGNYVFTSSGYGDGGTGLLKIVKTGDTFKAEEVYWKSNSELQNHHGGMILWNGHIYMGHGHNNGFPICVEMLTGKTIWGGKRGPGSKSAAVTLVDGHIIFRYENGVVALVSAKPDEYVLKGTFEIDGVGAPSWAHPVVSRGRLLLREQDRLICYDLTAPAAK